MKKGSVSPILYITLKDVIIKEVKATVKPPHIGHRKR